VNVLGRAGRLLKSSVGTVLAPAGDPRPGFALTYQRHSDLLKKVRLARSELRSAREQIDRHRSEPLDQIPVLDEKARSALLAGCDSAARSALTRRVTAAASAGDPDRFLLRASAGSCRALQRGRGAAAHQRGLAGLTGELADLGLALEQAEDSATWMQVRASALHEVMAAGPTGDQLEDGPRAPAGLDAEVEARLARLASDLRRPVP